MVIYIYIWASQVVIVVKNLPSSSGDLRGGGLIPGSGRTPGRGHGSPLQYSCLENPMDRGAWQLTVHGVARIGHDLEMKPPHYHNFVFAFELPK